ncbi:ATP-binding protein [Lewinella sp. W8]|uniref:ATP-binding protein n=1 Tax=Lewinella sp. W8 TaxID=2528208 RepID=UPI001068CE80|nr:ATP-binding protein [Lewinella sp. W8]MTB53804.1 response regulator [Lewinella sp. W8]
MCRVLTILVCGLLSLGLPAQELISLVDHYTTTNGLSHNSVHHIYEDSRGLIWLSTRYGVNRFDGERFKVYTKEEHGLHFNMVGDIHEDHDGMLWMVNSQNNNLLQAILPNIRYTIFDPILEQAVDPAEYLPPNFLEDLNRCYFHFQVDDGSMIFLSQDGYFLRYYGRDNYERVELSQNIPRQNNMGQASSNSFWALLRSYRSETSILSRINFRGEILDQLSLDRADYTPTFKQYYPSSGINWRWMSPSSGKPRNYATYDSLGNMRQYDLQALFPEIPDNANAELQFLDLANDLHWIYYSDTIFLMRPGEGVLGTVPHVTMDHYALRGKDGTIYGCDQNNGLWAVNLTPNSFRKETSQEFLVRQASKDKNGKLWVGLDPFNRRRVGEDLAEVDDSVQYFWNYTVMQDDAGDLWLGPDVVKAENENSSPYLLRFDGKEMTEYRGYRYTTIDDLKYWLLWQHPVSKKIWVGPESGGIRIIDPEVNMVESFQDDDNHQELNKALVYFATLDSTGNTLLCTSRGVFFIDRKNRVTGQYGSGVEGENYLPVQDFHHVYIDENKVLWLASGDGGLLKWDYYGDGSYRQYTIADGLSSNVLHSIYPDKNGLLWISSEEGLIRFNKEDGFSQNYDVKHGTINQEFNRVAHFRDDDGRIYLGGLNGLMSFHPDDFPSGSTISSRSYITPIDVLRVDNSTGKVENLLPTLLAENTIFLTEEAPAAELVFRSPQLSRNQHYLTYHIEGITEQFTPITESVLPLRGIPYGAHQMIVRASDFRGNKLEEKQYKIHRSPPWYLQTWVRSLMLAGFALVIWFIVHLRTRWLEHEVNLRTKDIEASQEVIRRQTVELQKLDALKSRFFENISHDLRTPLTLLLQPINKLKQHEALDDQDRQALERASINGDRMLTLINDIFNLSMLETGKLPLNPVTTNLKGLLENIVFSFSDLAAEKQVRIAPVCTVPPPLWIKIDRDKLSTLLQNLLQNAIKYTDRGGTVKVACSVDEENFHIHIIDTGRGISPQDLPHIFDRFYQAKQHSGRAEGGSGIGLAICRELTTLMGGSLSVVSELGVGSTFKLALPLVATVPPEEEQAIVAPEVEEEENFSLLSATDHGPQAHRVLVVEDNADLREFYQSALSPYFKISLAADGLQALDILQANKQKGDLPELIITDLMMPQMDGFQFLEQIKADQALALIPTVVVSARVQHPSRMKALQIGVDDYVTKPFQEEELLQRIRNLIQNANVRKQALLENTELVDTPNEPSAPEALSPEDRIWVNELSDYIRNHLTDPNLSTESVAAAFFVSGRTLSRKTKSLTGLSPNKFILEVRMQVARELLGKVPRPTLLEITQKIGLRKASYFSRKFKNRYGIRPADFRPNILQEVKNEQ